MSLAQVDQQVLPAVAVQERQRALGQLQAAMADAVWSQLERGLAPPQSQAQQLARAQQVLVLEQQQRLAV